MPFEEFARVPPRPTLFRSARFLRIAAPLFRTVPRSHPTEASMLGWAIAFFIVALIAGFLGFGGIAGAAAGIAELLFWVFVVLFILSLVASMVSGRRTPVP
jgi:uncharacterized membrane protein YtjA (UPF0391 family)